MKMKYSIEVADLTDADYPLLGVEIRPPLGELAAQGLCRALMQQPDPEETSYDASVENAYVTRNDAEGTALFIAWRYPRAYDTEYAVGLRIQAIIDPCFKHEVEIPEEGDIVL
jgi:hypothetical protein